MKEVREEGGELLNSKEHLMATSPWPPPGTSQHNTVVYLWKVDLLKDTFHIKWI